MRFQLIRSACCWFAALALGCGAAGMEPDRESAIGEVESAVTAAPMPAPFGYWRLDDCLSAQSTLKDSSSNMFTATKNSGVTCNASGKVKVAGSFNGTTGQLTVPNSTALTNGITNAITVAAWVKPATVPTMSSKSYGILTKWNNSKDSFKLQLTSAGYKFTVAFPPPSGSTTEREVAVTASTSLSSTNWTHVAGVYNSTTGALSLYVNGSLAASAMTTGKMQTSTTALLIGNSPSTASTTYGFSGLIDEAWLGGQALTQTQIQALMNGPHADAYGGCLEASSTSKVLVVAYDQYHASFHKDQATHGNAIIGDVVAASHQFVDNFRQTSHGLVNYQITDIKFVNGEPPQMADGSGADYSAIFQQNNICSLVQNQNLSEVWVWGDGSAHMDELAYKVPGDAIPYRSNAESPWFYDLRTKNMPDCGKTIWVMGYNYTVGFDQAIHSFNHRVESILSMIVGHGRWYHDIDPNNPWFRFSLITSMGLGTAGIGNTHAPANSVQEEYDNQADVLSTAAAFDNYPFIDNTPAANVDCNAWGCSQLGYQNWYDGKLPHALGTSYGGACNNWWTYVADYDRRLASCTGTACLQPVGGLCAANGQCASNNCQCGKCANAGTTPTCLKAPFDPCTAASQCSSGICGCTGETGTRACLPNSAYVTTCKQPAGGSCWGDADCASAICGCNGGATVMCLQAGQSRTCNAIGNWEACLKDADCASGVCGCNGGPRPMVCLPSDAYSRACSN